MKPLTLLEAADDLEQVTSLRCRQRSIPFIGIFRVWLGTGVTDVRRGMNTLTLQVQEDLGRDPHAGDLYVFRGRRGDLVKILWSDGVGTSLYAKRLERGRFQWPAT